MTTVNHEVNPCSKTPDGRERSVSLLGVLLLKTFYLSSGGGVAAERIPRLPILFQPTRERGRKEGRHSVAGGVPCFDGLIGLCDHFAAADRINRHPTVLWCGVAWLPPVVFGQRFVVRCGAGKQLYSCGICHLHHSYHAENAILLNRRASPQLFLHHRERLANTATDYVK